MLNYKCFIIIIMIIIIIIIMIMIVIMIMINNHNNKCHFVDDLFFAYVYIDFEKTNYRKFFLNLWEQKAEIRNTVE